jgi:hypothetical protein
MPYFDLVGGDVACNVAPPGTKTSGLLTNTTRSQQAGDPAKEAEATDIIAAVGFDPKYVGPIRFGTHPKSAP